MTAITLESDSSHSPPLLTKSNERSSKKRPQKAENLLWRGGFSVWILAGTGEYSPVDDRRSRGQP